MTGFEVYKMYLALRQHFTKENYDYTKYRGKVSASEKSYLERRDRYFFDKLASKYNDKEVFQYFIANFILDPRGYIKTFSVGNYDAWKIHNESLSYKLRQDVSLLLTKYASPYQDKFDKIFDIEENQHPMLIKYYLAGDIALETLVIFEKCLGFVAQFDKKLTDPIWKDVRMKVTKYLPFLPGSCEKYRQVILTEIRTKL